jgi:hypothetical protein
MHKAAALLFASLLAVLFIACGTSVNPSEDACSVDADCAPVSCCHATACGAASKKADACNVACTADCQGGDHRLRRWLLLRIGPLRRSPDELSA